MIELEAEAETGLRWSTADDRADFTVNQISTLLAPVNPTRVVTTTDHAHLSQQDVTAHLIRVFGFGHFDTEIRETECIFEHNRLTNDGKVSQRWDVGYRSVVRLTVRNPDQQLVAFYENGSTAAGRNLPLAEAHDIAFKSSISLAMKRCAINLGDQFGLSLYNNGQIKPLVIGTLVNGPNSTDSTRVERHGVEQETSDETELGSEPGGQVVGLQAALDAEES